LSESTLSINLDDLLLEVAAFLGYGSDSTAWTDDQKAEMDRYVQSGVRQFYYPPAVGNISSGREWSFLMPRASLTTTIDQDSDDLPATLSRVNGDMYFSEGPHLRSVPLIGQGRLLALRQKNADKARPKCAAVAHKGSTGSDGQRLEILWWPTPDAEYELDYQYEAYAGKLTEANPYPLGGMKYAELIIESCLSVAEQRANDERGAHYERFIELLAASVEQDRKVGAQYFGFMGQPEDKGPFPRRALGHTYPVSYKGDTW